MTARPGSTRGGSGDGVRARRGVVATPHHLASASGLAALQAGGSAVDAAIAANAVLAVAYPHMAGVGGDGFWMIAEPGEAPRGINASGPAAASADRATYRRRVPDGVIPASGPLAALTVPGAVDGWRLAHEAYGRLAWGQLFESAIELAERGVEVSSSLAHWSARDEAELQDHPTAAALLVDGRAGRPGDRLSIPDLAATLRRLAGDGARAGFYEGRTATRIGDGCSAAGSPLRASDLAAYRAEWVTPVSVGYHGARLWQLPPNTQGLAALQLAALTAPEDLGGFGDRSADLVHRAVEATKVAFADRDAWVTDPRFLAIPLDRLLDDDYLAARRRLVDPDRATPFEHVRPGLSPTESVRRIPDGGTVHVAVVDETGLAVSLIQSIYHDFGAMFVPPGTGVLLQNRGSFFSLDDAHPNRLEPGKRTFHTLIPALLADDTRRLVFGTMGGEGQPQTQLALLVRIHDLGQGVQEALDGPRWLFGRTWGDATRTLALEAPFGDEVADDLRRRGHDVRLLPDRDDTFGHAQAILVHADGTLEGGADPRSDGVALGW